MGFSDIPADTDAEKILQALDLLNDKFDGLSKRLDNFAQAINGLGMNSEWLTNNAKDIFKMFGDPKFMSMLPTMLNPAGLQDAAKKMEGVNNGGQDGTGPAATAE